MGVPASEVGYTSATTGKGDHEVHKERVVALAKEITQDNILHCQRSENNKEISLLVLKIF
jgi:hypothetical protein